jgi:hypothetical protein
VASDWVALGRGAAPGWGGPGFGTGLGLVEGLELFGGSWVGFGLGWALALFLFLASGFGLRALPLPLPLVLGVS